MYAARTPETSMPDNGGLTPRNRLDDLGGRITRVVHELNGPLSLIVGSIENLDRHLDVFVRYVRATEDHFQNDPALLESYRHSGVSYAAQNAPRLMAVCEEGVQRLRHVLQQLKSYAGQPFAPRREKIDVAEATRQAVRMAGHGRSSLPVLELEFDGVPRAVGDPNELGQVLTNLLENAFDAVAGREDPRVWISARLDDTSGYVEVRVRDNGPGVPAPNRRSIFEPFFTTKNGGAGLGLGLAISRESMEAQGGSLALVEAPEKGAEFLLRLPAAHVRP
jgi:two-component system sensor histidine kinase HupT/HoxJ